jgi:hypothetical protein
LGWLIGLVGVFIEIYSGTLPDSERQRFVKVFGLVLILSAFLLFVAMK